MAVTDPNHPAHVAGQRSRAAVAARDKDAWLAVFADDAIVQDPIGPSFFDPEGKGHQGKEAIAAFWDKAIAPTDNLEFRIFSNGYTGAIGLEYKPTAPGADAVKAAIATLG